MSDRHYVGLDLTGFEDNGVTRPISRVTLLLDDNNYITAGDDTGYNLEADCPYGTQEMAEAMLRRLKGYQYQMYSASAVNIDPAAELGDGVTLGGVYSTLSRLSDDGGGYPDAEAPGEAELEDEYPTAGPMTRAFERKLAQTRSYITKTSEQITQRIEEVSKGATEELEAYAESVTKSLGELQSQIDGNIMTWFYDYEPTTANEPAGLWTTEAEKIRHLGDVFYIVDNEEKGGQAYRWEYVNGAYRWSLIEDVELAKALADAARAQDTADGKRRTFTAQPTPPYDEGDLWAGGPDGELMRCIHGKASGSFDSGDWDKASKYTDDSYAKQRASEIDQRIDSIRLSVSDQKGETFLKLTVGDTELSSEKITITGYVTFKNLSTPGETDIIGNNIVTGKISDAEGNNVWDLDEGTLTTYRMEANEIDANGTFECGDGIYSVRIEKGTMTGYLLGEQVGYIDYSASATYHDSGETVYGIQMQSDGIIRVSTPHFSMSDSSDVYDTAWDGYTGEITAEYVIGGQLDSYGNINFYTQTLTLNFINGILTTWSKW